MKVVFSITNALRAYSKKASGGDTRCWEELKFYSKTLKGHDITVFVNPLFIEEPYEEHVEKTLDAVAGLGLHVPERWFKACASRALKYKRLRPLIYAATGEVGRALSDVMFMEPCIREFVRSLDGVDFHFNCASEWPFMILEHYMLKEAFGSVNVGVFQAVMYLFRSADWGCSVINCLMDLYAPYSNLSRGGASAAGRARGP